MSKPAIHLRSPGVSADGRPLPFSRCGLSWHESQLVDDQSAVTCGHCKRPLSFETIARLVTMNARWRPR